jgi:MoaA/NifB/PqqE/SkfB family radical SAM enzyme
MDPYIDPDALDPSNPYHAQKRENLQRGDVAHRTRAEILDALPVKITLQTTDVCNLHCPHCQIPRALKTPRMGRDVLERVIDELFPTLIELHPTNLGEPMTWPLFERLCRAMKHHGVLLDLTTNGTLLTHRRIEWLRPIARDIKVSFDGATHDTFERLRRGARFDQVCSNVRRLVAALQREPRRPTVSLQMTLMRSNIRELPSLVRLGAELGVHRVKAYHLFSFMPEMDAESLMHDLDSWTPVLDEAMTVAHRLGIAIECAELPATPGATPLMETTCHLPWHETWIDLDGAVLPCHSHGGDVAGNILQATFAEIWNGALYRRIRRGYALGKLDWRCNGCGMNCERTAADQPVPYDYESFLSPQWRSAHAGDPRSLIRWSGRMRQFDLTGRRKWH